MVLRVAGFNLFNQWSDGEPILRTFTEVLVHKRNVEVIFVSWCYNVLRHINQILISGLYAKNELRCRELKFPSEVSNDYFNIVVSGNDRHLLLLDKVSQKIWKCDLDKLCSWEWTAITPFWGVERSLEQSNNTTENNAIVKIVAGCTMNLCLTSNGSIYEIPQIIDTSQCLGKIMDIQCGHEHTIALTDNGNVYTWGNGRRCQLGHGDLHNLDTPRLVEALAGVAIVRVRAGGWHSCALSEQGDMYIWGWNDTGQLGVKQNQRNEHGSHQTKKLKSSQYDTVSSLAIPTLVDLYDSLDNPVECHIVDIGCGSKHTVLILDDNSVWAAGSNKYNQLGKQSESVENFFFFTKVLQIRKPCSVMCGPWTTVIKSD